MGKRPRNGERRQRPAIKTRKENLSYYIVVTDTQETEKNYLMGLKNSLPQELQDRIIIKVFQARTENLVNKCIEVASAEPQYREKWIVFDRDQVANFDDIIKDAERNQINVGWSNPCIEIWFDAYFGTMHPYPDSMTCCSKFPETFKKKTKTDYKKSDKNTYALLNRYGDEKKAIQIAEHRHKDCLLDPKAKPSTMCPCTTLHYLVEEIKQKANV